MDNNKTCNIRCTKCRMQSECTSLDESLKNVRCGLDGGHLNDSCKVNLTLDGKPIFEIKQVVEFGKTSNKYDSKKDDYKNNNKSNAKSK